MHDKRTVDYTLRVLLVLLSQHICAERSITTYLLLLVSLCCRPPFAISIWPGIRIRHRLLDMPITLTKTHNISYYQAYRLRRILSSNYAVLLFTRPLNSHVFHILPLQGTTWNSFRNRQANKCLATQETELMLRNVESNPSQYV